MELLTTAAAPTAASAAAASSSKADAPLAHAMTKAEIDRIVQKFAAAALRAKKAGYDGCEIHSAHGYLLNQFYSPLTNHRADAYGSQSVDNRIRLHLAVIKAVREVIGRDMILSLRLGACDYGPGGTTVEDSVYAAKKMEEAGIDMISISGGMCNYTNPFTAEPGYFSDASEAVKKAVNIPVMLAGGIARASEAEALLAAGKADLIGVGRAILSDSGWAEREMQ